MNRQMNFADFTGIYLYPEAFGTQYIYDKNGNRKTRKMLYGGQEKSEFDDADNLTKHTAAGRTVSSTFHYGDTEAEQKKHLLLKSIAPLGSVGTFTYDAFGNPLTSQVQNADANPKLLHPRRNDVHGRRQLCHGAEGRARQDCAHGNRPAARHDDERHRREGADGGHTSTTNCVEL